MEVKEIFGGVFKIDGRLATKNLVKGGRVYDEELVHVNRVEYRMWNPYRSKLAAAIMKGLKKMKIEKGDDVLYLGAATGTTSSHISDMVGIDGTVYCIEISERNMRELLKACETRENMLPLLQDARETSAYSGDVGPVDIIYQDLSARDQAEILIKNSSMLKSGGFAYVAIKSQSIDISKAPERVYREFLLEVSKRFELIESVSIEPYDKMHMFVVLQKKGEKD